MIRRNVVPALVFAAFVLAMCWRVWTPIAGARGAFNWDAQWEYWGDLALEVHAAEHRELPLWNPYDRMGHPFLADPQAGVLYPPNWPIVGLGLLFGPGFWMVTLKIMLHLWLWGFGVFVWLRRRKLPAAACYLAGFFVLLEYPTTYGLFSALNWPMAWAPFALIAIDRLTEDPRVGRGAALALALALGELAGGPASFWYTLLVAVPYGVWAVVDRKPPWRRLVPALAVAGGLFLAMVAAQTLVTSQLVPLTVRAERDLDFIGGSVLISDNLFSLVVSRLPALPCYLGLVNVFAAFAAVTLRPSGRTYTLAGIAAGGLILAMGTQGGWLPELASVFPIAGLFRKAHRYVYVTLIPFGALVAEGLDVLAKLEDGARRRAAWMLAGLGFAGVVIFGCGVVATHKGPQAHHDAYIISFFACAAAAWALRQIVVTEGAWRARFVVIAVVVAVADLWLAHAGDFLAVDKDGKNLNFWPPPTTPNDAQARSLPGVPLAARIDDREYFKYRPGARLAIRDLSGYEGDPLALRRYSLMLRAIYADAHVLGHANVRWVTGTKGPQPLRIPPDFKTHGRDVWEVPAVAPAVAWYGGADVVDGEEAALDHLRRTTPGTIAVLESPARAAAPDPARPPVAGRLVELGLNHLTAEIDAPADGVVVVAEAYHPGWRATVDGADAPLIPANAAFRGVQVGPGKHTIVMRFGVGALATLLIPISTLSFLAAALLALLRRR